MMGVLMALGWLLLTLLKIAGVLLLILLVLLALVLLCPLCADVCWEGGVLTVRAGALGLTLPVFQWPAPEKPAGAEEPKGFWGKLKAKLRARREERKRKKAAAKEAKRPKKETAPRRKAKLTLNILVTILRGAGRLTKAIFGSLRVTKIRVRLGVRGEDPAEAARAYGRLNAWLYPSLGVIDRFVYLDFDELRILPDFGSGWPTGCRSTSAQGCFSSLQPLCAFCMSSGAKKCWTSSYKVCYNNIVWCILLSRGSFPGK